MIVWNPVSRSHQTTGLLKNIQYYRDDPHAAVMAVACFDRLKPAPRGNWQWLNPVIATG
jgi:hypothetical protein